MSNQGKPTTLVTTNPDNTIVVVFNEAGKTAYYNAMNHHSTKAYFDNSRYGKNQVPDELKGVTPDILGPGARSGCFSPVSDAPFCAYVYLDQGIEEEAALEVVQRLEKLENVRSVIPPAQLLKR